MNEQEDHLQQASYGDDKVHFDPIRAVQSINLSNNYRTARSNANFLSTIVLNTYFFNNAVVHHNEIQQAPPKLPYEADSYHSSSANSSSSSCESSSSNSSGDESCSSCDCSNSSTQSNSYSDDIKTQINTKIKHQISASQSNLSNINCLKSNQPRRYKFGNKFRKKKSNQNIGNSSLSDLEYAQSTPNYNNNAIQHQKSNTMTNLYYVPSKAHDKHRANPNKASQILGINSDAVIFANNKNKMKKNQKKNVFTHRKSNSFSETLRNINKTKTNEENKNENDHEFVDNDEEVMDDDEFLFKQLKFDKFKPQKRNTGRHISRSQTVDFTSNNQNININEIINKSKKSKIKKKHIKHISLNNNNKRYKNNSNSNSIESSDVIEIKFKIDYTKKGYLFIGIISANKINNVVQPGFIFGFNEYTYSFHGYSGKLYHNKIQNDYYFLPNNITNNNKQQKNKQKQQRINRSNTVDVTQGISGITNASQNQNNQNEIITSSQTIDIKQQEEEPLNNNNNNKKLPVLQSGDIITIKMKLNKNNGKFGVIYCINNIDYGIAWKTIDPPITIGITMVGRKEQISLLSCCYKPYKNDKSCVIL